MGGAFRLKWVGLLQLRWVGQLWQSELLLFERYAQTNTGLQEITLLVPLMGTVTARDRDRGTEKMTEKQG